MDCHDFARRSLAMTKIQAKSLNFCRIQRQKQSSKFAQRGCPRKKLDLLTQIFSFGSKRFASFYTLFLLSLLSLPKNALRALWIFRCRSIWRIQAKTWISRTKSVFAMNLTRRSILERKSWLFATQPAGWSAVRGSIVKPMQPRRTIRDLRPRDKPCHTQNPSI